MHLPARGRCVPDGNAGRLDARILRIYEPTPHAPGAWFRHVARRADGVDRSYPRCSRRSGIYVRGTAGRTLPDASWRPAHPRRQRDGCLRPGPPDSKAFQPARDRAGSDFLGSGVDRVGKRAPVRRGAGAQPPADRVPGATDGDKRHSQRHLQLADQPAAGVRYDCREVGAPMRRRILRGLQVRRRTYPFCCRARTFGRGP